MSIKNFIFLAIIFLFLTTACVPFVGSIELGVETATPANPIIQPTPGNTETPVQNPMTEPTATPTEAAIPAGATGTAVGRVCYPSEAIPAMTAFFQEEGTGDLTELAIGENQFTYTVELPVGTYKAFAWQNDFKVGGAYTAYVACGFTEDCTDHTLQTFEILYGQETANIDLCDWPFTVDQLPIPGSALIDSPLAGLRYSELEGGFYELDPAGNSLKIEAPNYITFSPDKTNGIYFQNNDLYIVDLFGGQVYNLTNTPSMVELNYEWTASGRIFFTAIAEEQAGGPGVTGGLYVINVDGTGFTAIDEEANTGNFSVTQDGRFVAYGIGPTTFIYDLELKQRGLFDPSTFGLVNIKGLSLFSPAWSPNGQMIAWMMNGEFNGMEQIAVGVFDIATNTFQILHPYQILGMDGFLGPVIWSPTGNWLAVTAFDGNPARNGIWIISVTDPNQTTEFFLGTYSVRPHWSPNGEQVVFTQYLQTEQVGRSFVFDLPTLSINPIPEIPEDAYIIGW
ncbi:MAG: hypothetical protein Fur0022_28310 [Anaerolineales bacterium]